MQVEVYDIAGKYLFQAELKGSEYREIPIGHLYNGIYLLKIYDGAGFYFQRFIKNGF